jgi:uncharacterized protein (TIGR03083 family)
VVTLRRDLSEAEVEELLGAYALDACEPREVEAIEAVLSRRPDLAAEAARLSRVAAWLGAAEALEPPTRLRRSVMDTTAPRRDVARLDSTAAAVELYRLQSGRFEDAVNVVSDGALDEMTANGLTAHDLIVHEAAQESLLAHVVGASPIPEVSETHIEERTAAMIELFRHRRLEDVVALWRASVDANCAWAAERSGTGAVWRGLELDHADAIVVRAFETWIHTDDLRRVVGLPGLAPPARDLALMTDLAGRSLSMSLALVGRTTTAKTARLVLTGDGGGDWLVAMDGTGAGSGRADVTVTASAVDWCLLVGDRIAPAELKCSIDGDAALAVDLLGAAPALATL